MTTGIHESSRRVIPRWRSLRTTASTGELDTLRKKGPASELDSSDFEVSLQEWRTSPSLGVAFEVVAGALLLNRLDDGRSAAQALVQSPSASQLSRSLAKELLAPDLEGSLGGPEKVQLVTIAEDQESRLRIAAMRRTLVDYPANPYMWVDLAREYTLIGQGHAAEWAIKRALSLAPNNRFVLRSAARLFIHRKKPDEALGILQKSPATTKDPWLLAAHLATTQVADASPQHIKLARDIAQSGDFSPLQTSELSSAIGSLEINAFNLKQGRRFINLSLQDPTENSMAQAVWLAKKTKSIEVKADVNKVDRSFEAKARLAYISGSWKQALEECNLWCQDESFSSRPATLGSFIATTVLDDPRLGEVFAERGRRANPTNTLLLNNQAVALAYQGRLAEAEEAFRQISKIDPEATLRATVIATEGLLAFRAGDPERGRARYEKAMEVAEKNSGLRAFARMHLAQEEMNYSLEFAEASLSRAEIEFRDAGDPDPAKAFMLNRLKARLEKQKGTGPTPIKTINRAP